MKSSFGDKLIGIFFIALFFLLFFQFISSKELVCSKKLGECYLRKVFYQEQVLDTFDMDLTQGAFCKYKSNVGLKGVSSSTFYLKTENQKAKIFKTDFCNKKADSFNTYLKNDAEDYKMREFRIFNILMLILSLVVFVPMGVVMLKGKVEIDKNFDQL